MTCSLLILASGAFGRDVAGRLAQWYPAATLQEIDDGTHPSLWPHADLMVLATSREFPRVAEALDRAAFAWLVPWFAVHAHAVQVQCGPVVVPGLTACYQCFVRRREQHRRPGYAVGTADAADDRFPSGYPSHHVGIAAAFARQAVHEAFGAPDSDRLTGTVRMFDQVSGVTSRSSVVAVNRCSRCRASSINGELWHRLAAADGGRRQ